ncbi:myb-like protein X [Bolinopsis microptera]|uniref:myb-like protein X n=1 Tax=Bolinopsis microptera TaxID=2820187 RepID=UPI0030799E96
MSNKNEGSSSSSIIKEVNNNIEKINSDNEEENSDNEDENSDNEEVNNEIEKVNSDNEEENSDNEEETSDNEEVNNDIEKVNSDNEEENSDNEEETSDNEEVNNDIEEFTSRFKHLLHIPPTDVSSSEDKLVAHQGTNSDLEISSSSSKSGQLETSTPDETMSYEDINDESRDEDGEKNNMRNATCYVCAASCVWKL